MLSLQLFCVCTVVTWAAVAEGGSPLTARDVIWKFSQGNSRYIAQSTKEGHNFKRKFNAFMFNKLSEDPLKPVQRQAIILSDIRSFAAVEEVFNCTVPGETQAIRVAGCVCKPHDQCDGAMCSVEYALMQPQPPPLLLVIGNSQNEVVADAVKLAMSESSDAETASEIVKAVLPAARDAILQDPHASFDDLCDTAAKLNVWNTIEAMLTTSREIYDAAKSGVLEVHGAFLDSQTGKVFFMGEHPALEALLVTRPVHVRTASDPTVPPEEAIAMLVAGNKRYVKGHGLRASSVADGDRNKALTEAGQSPFAVIVGCADSRAPPDILFDARPGNLFILRTAGNTFAAGLTSILGSAEYAVGHLRSKLIVVMGHTKCGAVTAAVEAVKANQNLKGIPGSIGMVLEDLIHEATEAVNEMPGSSVGEVVSRAAELNVIATMEKIIKSSPIIAEGIRTMDVQVHGAIYDIETGEVRFLGQHPKLAEVLKTRIPVHSWKYDKPYARAKAESQPLAATELEILRNGNTRFRNGKTTTDSRSEDPYGIVVAGSELRVPVENIFDTGRGEILVQRSMGAILGHSKNALLESLEYSVQRHSPKLMLVLGSSDSPVINAALNHLNGEPSTYGATHIVHEAVCASALGAVLQTSPAGNPKTILTSAGRERKRRGLCVELNSLYTVEQLLRHSKIIRDAVREKKLEIHVGILQEETGKVNFIGKHPMEDELVKDDAGSHSLAQVEQTSNSAYVTSRPDSAIRRLSALMKFLLK